jgi:uncharacterized protein (TIGR02466 family)
MNVSAVNPYPPLIYGGHFEFTKEHTIAAHEILNTAQNTNSHLEAGNANSSVASQFAAPHRHSIFQDFFVWAQKIAIEILQNQQIADPQSYYVGNSWINRHGLGGETLAHNHGHSALSLVAYIDLPVHSGFTEFKDPHYEFKSLYEYTNESVALKEFFPVRVRQNDVLFFPGWLMHKSGRNFNKDDRIVLSANFINFTHRVPLTFGDL